MGTKERWVQLISLITLLCTYAHWIKFSNYFCLNDHAICMYNVIMINEPELVVFYDRELIQYRITTHVEVLPECLNPTTQYCISNHTCAMQELFEGRIYFIHLEQENWCRNNSRVGRIQGNTVCSGLLRKPRLGLQVCQSYNMPTQKLLV